MPTNFRSILNKPVTRLKTDEVCTWENHLRWGRAWLSIWRQINKMNSVKKDGVCYGSIEGLRKKSAKFEDGKRGGHYGYDMFQRVLADFQKAGMISCRFYEDEGEYAGLEVFQVFGQRMHDQLCKREGSKCRYLGWQYAARLGMQKGTPSGTPKGTPVSEKGTPKGTPAGTPDLEKGYASGYATKTTQVPHNVQLQPTPCGEICSSGAPNHLVIQSLGANTKTEESAAKEKTTASDDEEKASPAMTDQRQETQPCKNNDQTRTLVGQDLVANGSEELPRAESAKRIVTIGEHFGDSVTIDKISMGEIDWDALDKKYRHTHVSQDTMVGYCQQAVAAKKDLPYAGPQTHGNLMVDAMLLLDKSEGRKPPECWYPVAKKLRANPPVFSTAAASADFTSVWVRALELSGVKGIGPGDMAALSRECKTYRDGWTLLAKWITYDDSPIAKLRDWLWENDAMSDKPTAPPWTK
jgi:hypothetical protein